MKLREILKTPPKIRSKTGASTLTNPIQADSGSSDLFAWPRTVRELVSLTPVRTTYPYCLSQEPSPVRFLIVHPYTVQQENLSLTPQNGFHLASSLPHCSIQCHWYSMSGMLLLHLYLLTAPSEITLILSTYESNLPPSASAHHWSPERKPPHLQGPQLFTGAGSHHFSNLVCLFYLLMVRTSQARFHPRIFFFRHISAVSTYSICGPASPI